jgi:hypothetical protein
MTSAMPMSGPATSAPQMRVVPPITITAMALRPVSTPT